MLETLSRASSVIDLHLTAPSYVMPPTSLFAHASRVADAWAPSAEVVALPPRRVGEGEIAISARPGNTRELGIPLRTANPRRMINRLRTIRVHRGFVFDARFDTGANVAHQICNVAPLVQLARRELSAAFDRDVEMTVILRDGASGFSWFLHQHMGVEVIATDARVEGHLVRVRNPYVGTYQGGQLVSASGSHASMSLTPGILSRALDVPAHPAGDLPEKIFIARRGSRSITNEAEVTKILERRGYRKFYFEDEPYARQILLCRNARSVVAIHGAAMACLAFNGRGLDRPAGDLGGLRIVELCGAGYSMDVYRRLAAILNAHWCCVRGAITPQIVRDLDVRNDARSHEKAPFRIDPESLRMALDYSEHASRNRPINDPRSCSPWSPALAGHAVDSASNN